MVWALRGYQIRDDAGKGQHIGTYQRKKEEGLLMAASPELLAACEAVLRACDEIYPPAMDAAVGAELLSPRMGGAVDLVKRAVEKAKKG
jgi:hypothetical protein